MTDLTTLKAEAREGLETCEAYINATLLQKETLEGLLDSLIDRAYNLDAQTKLYLPYVEYDETKGSAVVNLRDLKQFQKAHDKELADTVRNAALDLAEGAIEKARKEYTDIHGLCMDCTVDETILQALKNLRV